jgi:hypothetical protein
MPGLARSWTGFVTRSHERTINKLITGNSTRRLTMYLAPLNYDRFFKKVFSNPEIARKFLEDLLDTKIENLKILKEQHRVTDDAAFVEFDFRCKIDGAHIIIDMQQWYKPDVAQRFYLYNALNTGLQLEKLPKRKIVIDTGTRQIKKVKDYRLLEPVYTIIWMVDDTLAFKKEDFVSYIMAPEIVVKFVQNEKLWNKKNIKMLMEKRADVMKVLSNNTKELDFFAKNRLVFLFQKNIVRNQKMEKYVKWFEFAEKTKNEKNQEEDFKTFTGDPLFSEIMRKLDKTKLTDEELEYIKRERESWEEVKRYDKEHYEEGLKQGLQEGEIKGKIEVLKTILKNKSLPDDFINSTKTEVAALTKQLEEIRNKEKK